MWIRGFFHIIREIGEKNSKNCKAIFPVRACHTPAAVLQALEQKIAEEYERWTDV